MMLIWVQGNCACEFLLLSFKDYDHPLYLFVMSVFSEFGLNIELRSIKSLN